MSKLTHLVRSALATDKVCLINSHHPHTEPKTVEKKKKYRAISISQHRSRIAAEQRIKNEISLVHTAHAIIRFSQFLRFIFCRRLSTLLANVMCVWLTRRMCDCIESSLLLFSARDERNCKKLNLMSETAFYGTVSRSMNPQLRLWAWWKVDGKKVCVVPGKLCFSLPHWISKLENRNRLVSALTKIIKKIYRKCRTFIEAFLFSLCFSSFCCCWSQI